MINRLKSYKLLSTNLILSILILTLLCGCDTPEQEVKNTAKAPEIVVEKIETPVAQDSNSVVLSPDENIEDEEDINIEADENTINESTGDVSEPDNTQPSSEETTKSTGGLPPVIWLGDSLTQGSLGDDNGNVNNPQAPWRVVANHGVNITGYGYYAYPTHDIFWKFGEDGGKKDCNNIYIFWVGANDFVLSDTAVNDVIGEINNFVQAGSIDKYIVVGTTDRELLGHDKAVVINQTLKSTYGSKYIDILKYIEFGPDGTHLTASSYQRIGEAVYQKLINTY